MHERFGEVVALTAASSLLACAHRVARSPGLPSTFDGRLLWSLIGALTLHVLIGAFSWPRSEGADAGRALDNTMTVRLLSDSRRGEQVPQTKNTGEPPVGARTGSQADERPGAELIRPKQASQDLAEASQASSARRAPTADEEDEDETTLPNYRPAETLTEAPRLLDGASLSLSHPDEALPEGRADVRVALLISQSGQVDEVLVPADRLPPRFVKATQRAFLGQTFKPGRLGEQEVAARLCVVVRFQENERPRWDLVTAGALMNLIGPSGAGCEPEGSTR